MFSLTSSLQTQKRRERLFEGTTRPTKKNVSSGYERKIDIKFNIPKPGPDVIVPCGLQKLNSVWQSMVQSMEQCIYISVPYNNNVVTQHDAL